MKATGPGRVIGMALESFGFEKNRASSTNNQTNPNNQNSNDRNNCSEFGTCDLEVGASLPIGKVMVFVNPHWYAGQLADNGLLVGNELGSTTENSDGSLAASGSLAPTDSEKGTGTFSLIVEKVRQALASLGLFIENGIARIKELFAEKITTKQVCVEGDDGETICLDKNQLKEFLEKEQTIGGSAPE
jgi:hypothetical protein